LTSPAVVACTWGADPGHPGGDLEELLTLGKKVSASLRTDLRWLVLGPLPEGAADIARRFGAARIDHLADAALDRFQPDPYVEALAQYCGQSEPGIVLFPQTFDVRVAAPRLAGRLGSAVVMNAVDIESADGDRLDVVASAYGGDTRAVYNLSGPGPHVLAVMPNAVRPEPLEGATSEPEVRSVPVDLTQVRERIRVLQAASTEGPRLEEAQFIVGGGRGLGSPENYRFVEELADALGGMAAATRPLVDDGWADPSRQLGLTGKIARPALYIAAGVSGASQHMAGCSAAGTIVAINSDPDAPIFRHARYGIVADCLQVLEDLTRALRGGGA
jgi:electron transfer flavoprotein alpha subunit